MKLPNRKAKLATYRYLFGMCAVLVATASLASAQSGGPYGPPSDPMGGAYAPGGPSGYGQGSMMPQGMMPNGGGAYPASMMQPGMEGGGSMGGPTPMMMEGGNMVEDDFGFIGPSNGFVRSRNGMFYFQVDSLWLQRSAPANQPVALGIGFPMALGTRPYLELPASQIGYTMTAAPRLTFGYQAADSSAIEGSFFGWHYTRGQEDVLVPALGAGAFSGFTATLLGTTGGRSQGIVLDSSSKFFSSEVNYFQSLGWFSLMGGFRWFQFQDYFSVVAQQNNITGASNTYDINANNRLLGGQIGVRAQREIDLLTLAGTLKLGGYQDQVTVNQNATTSTGTNFRSSTVENSRGVLQTEAQIMATWLVNGNTTLRLGMDFWYFDGLSIAADNFDQIAPNPNANTLGSMFLYGPSMGVDVRF